MSQKELFPLNIVKDPENTSGLLGTTMEDLLNIHGGKNDVCSSDKVIDPCHPFLLPGMLWEPRHHPAKIHPSA